MADTVREKVALAVFDDEETINVDNLAAGNYSIRVSQVSGGTNYQLDVTLTTTNTQGTAGVDSLTGMSLVQANPVSAPGESAVSLNQLNGRRWNMHGRIMCCWWYQLGMMAM